MPGGSGPGVFGDLAGQDEVVAELRQAADAAAAVLRGEHATGMTHAWLFTGPPGSGRSVAARAFAAALLCPYGGCGRCPSCHQVRAGTHADLLLVRPDGLSYGVRQTRSLVLRAAGAPSAGRWHVVVFEELHEQLNAQPCFVLADAKQIREMIEKYYPKQGETAAA